MSFLVLLLVVLLEQFSASRRQLQRDGWLLGVLAAGPEVPAWRVLLRALGLPLLALGVLLVLIKPLWHGWLSLPLDVLVVLFCLGRGDLQASLGSFRDAWRRDDPQAALHAAERDLGVQGDDSAQLLARVQAQQAWRAYEGFFAVIFWYVLLGPLLALAYRLLALAADYAAQPAVAGRAAALRHALDWLPARLLAASFALVGNFAALSRQLSGRWLEWQSPAPGLVAEALGAACEAPRDARDDGLDSQWQLLVRAAVLWYALIAARVLLG